MTGRSTTDRWTNVTQAGTSIHRCGRQEPGSDEAGLVGDHHELGPVAGAELHEQPADVGLHRGVAHEQLLRDLGVGATAGDGLEHLPLPFGELLEQGLAVGGGAGLGTSGELLDETAGDLRGDERVPVGHDPHGVEEVDRERVLQQEAAGPGAERLVDVLVEVEGGEDHDACAGERLVAGDPPRGLEAVHDRHADVHQHDVGALAGHERHRLGAVGGLTDDLDVGLTVEQHREAAAHERLVVGDDHPDRHSVVPVGQQGTDAVAATGDRAHRELAAPQLDPLAHAEQAVASAGGSARRLIGRPTLAATGAAAPRPSSTTSTASEPGW